MSLFVLVLITGLGLAGLYFLLAVGLSLIFGLMDVLNIAHGAIFAVGAYTGIVVTQSLTFVGDLTLRFALGLLAAAVVGFVVGAVMEKLVIARNYGNHLAHILVTLGLGFVIVAVLGALFGHNIHTVTEPTWFAETVEILGANIPLSRLVVAAIALLLLGALVAFIRYTRHGLIIRAGAENRAMVRALGIDVNKSFTLVFAIGCALAAVGGVLGAVYYGGATPELGTSQLIFAFIVIVIGGLGSITGTAVAAVAVALIQQLFNVYTVAGLGDIAVVVLLIAVLLLRPQGLMGRKA